MANQVLLEALPDVPAGRRLRDADRYGYVLSFATRQGIEPIALAGSDTKGDAGAQLTAAPVLHVPFGRDRLVHLDPWQHARRGIGVVDRHVR